MTQFNNAMEIFKLLEKSNCRECNETTCLAFAGAVFTGKKALNECPRLEDKVIAKYGGKADSRKTAELDMTEAMNQLKSKINKLDFTNSAERVGGRYSNNRLTIKIFGKDFSVNEKGELSSDIHIHPWISAPFYNYIIGCKGAAVLGKWVPLRELEGGKDWYRLFGQRCEKPLKKIADTYTELFEDMIRLFNGKQVENHYSSDISLVLWPLPKFPMLICYWKPEDGLESDLNLFFDSTAEQNLNIESIYTLAAGLVRMFEKIAQRHG